MSSINGTSELLPEYNFGEGVRGKHHCNYQCGYQITIHKIDRTTTTRLSQSTVDTDSENPIMQSIKDRPHVSITTDELANWLASQPECWWFVDGDPVLIHMLYTPAAGDELADELRKLKKRIFIFDKTDGSTARGEPITKDRLEQLADRDNNRKERVFLCCWEDSDLQWLLAEDTEEARLFGDSTAKALTEA